VSHVTRVFSAPSYAVSMRRFRAAACVLVLAAACTGHSVSLEIQAPATFPVEPGGHERARVVRVVDGDTIDVEVTDRSDGSGAGAAAIGNRYRVRLIGIDTPESVDPRRPVECFGREASAAASALLDGLDVRLVKDVEEADRFDRLLRYVYLGDEMANARLVANGYARSYTYPPNVRHTELLVELERRARDADAGLWAPDTCDGDA
jgi:micrococcal nuclease